MAKSKEEQIFIGDGNKVIELTGTNKEAFIADREETAEAQRLVETEYQAKRDSRESALRKLAEIAGLTEEELASIL
jgi:hypothetical protein